MPLARARWRAPARAPVASTGVRGCIISDALLPVGLLRAADAGIRGRPCAADAVKAGLTEALTLPEPPYDALSAVLKPGKDIAAA